MLKKLTLIFLLFCLFSCKRKECSSSIKEVRLINKAEHSYSGKKDLVITDKDKIKNIESLLKKLKTDVSDKTSAQMNFGFVEVLYSTNECENIEYFNVVFTENYGDLIHYNSDKDYDYEYFLNQEIVEYIKMEMGMSENKKYE